MPSGETRPLNDPELLGILQQLIGAGNETTTKLINEMVRLLGQHHDEWWSDEGRPVAHPGRRRGDAAPGEPDAGDLPRRQPPTPSSTASPSPPAPGSCSSTARQTGIRRCSPIPTGSTPVDPNVRDHLAFGLGVHFCIGAPLSRLETAITLERLTARWHDFTLAASNTFEYEPSFMLRGLKDLFVEFTPARH